MFLTVPVDNSRLIDSSMFKTQTVPVLDNLLIDFFIIVYSIEALPLWDVLV